MLTAEGGKVLAPEKLRISNENDRLVVAAILIKNGYRVEQAKERQPGKKMMNYVLIIKDVVGRT